MERCGAGKPLITAARKLSRFYFRKIFFPSANRWFVLRRLSGVLLPPMEGLMRYLRLLVIFDLLVSTAAFADVAPCSKDRLKFCNDGKTALRTSVLAYYSIRMS